MSSQLKLDANPLSLVRGFPVKHIPIDKITARDVEHDQIFIDKYSKYLTGKLKLFATRMQLERIKPGFYRPTPNGLDYICDKVSEDDVQYVVDLVRLGDRPALHLYHNINKEEETPFLCPDDVAPYHAYRKLGIRVVPVLVLGSSKSLEESAITIRGFRCTYNPYTPHIDSIVAKEHRLVPSLLGANKPAPEECFDKLIDAVDGVKERLKQFHRGGLVDHHYHHTVYSILLRAHETLRAMKLLFGNDLFLNAATLVRTLYELTLTFYVDWLAPTQMYKYLQLASVMREKDWQIECERTMKEQIRRRLSQGDAKRIFDAKMFGFRLVSTVSEKARLFPFGEEHHRDIYAFLSKIVHHDFSMAARYTHTLDHGDESVFHEDARQTTIYCADIFTAAIVTRVIDDIGASGERSLEKSDG